MVAIETSPPAQGTFQMQVDRCLRRLQICTCARQPGSTQEQHAASDNKMAARPAQTVPESPYPVLEDLACPGGASTTSVVPDTKDALTDHRT